jgi:hypothetical protein
MVLRTVTMPCPGLDRDFLISMTSLSSRRASPGRVGLGHEISPPRPTRPPAIFRPPVTRRRMATAAVYHPLATNPWKTLASAADSSRWNGCGSNWAANCFIDAASIRKLAEVNFCPRWRSSKYNRSIVWRTLQLSGCLASPDRLRAPQDFFGGGKRRSQIKVRDFTSPAAQGAKRARPSPLTTGTVRGSCRPRPRVQRPPYSPPAAC